MCPRVSGLARITRPRALRRETSRSVPFRELPFIISANVSHLELSDHSLPCPHLWLTENGDPCNRRVDVIVGSPLVLRDDGLKYFCSWVNSSRGVTLFIPFRSLVNSRLASRWVIVTAPKTERTMTTSLSSFPPCFLSVSAHSPDGYLRPQVTSLIWEIIMCPRPMFLRTIMDFKKVHITLEVRGFFPALINE